MADENDIEIDIVDSDDPELVPARPMGSEAGQAPADHAKGERSPAWPPTKSLKAAPLNHTSDQVAMSEFPRNHSSVRPSASDVEPVRSVSDYRIPDWIDQLEDDRQDKENDFKSQQALASMLAEEEYYTGVLGRMPSSYATARKNRPPGPGPIRSMKYKLHDAKKRKGLDDRPSQSKRSASRDSRPSTTSADLPSHNTRWSKEEDDRLRHGLELYGYGSWKLIAAVVGSRNALQVKNHARHWKTSHKIPSEMASASEGERLERSRSAATTSADEDEDEVERGKRQRHARSPRIKWMETNVGRSGSCEPTQRRQSRALSMTSESGNDDFTGSEFGATSGYDTDCESRRSLSKSPSLLAREQHWKLPKIIPYVPPLPSPKIAPTMASSPYSSSPSHRNAISSMDEDEDVDIDIEVESSEGEAKLRDRFGKGRNHFEHLPKPRSISPFSISSVTSRSRPSSEYDSDSDTNSTGRRRHQTETRYEQSSSPGPSDVATTTTSSSDFYTSTNFNTSSSSINSTYTTYSTPKPSLKESSFMSIQRSLSHDSHDVSLLDKSQGPSTKERRTVSFGAVHVAELQPDINSHDEEELFSEGNGPRQATSKTISQSSTSPKLVSRPLFAPSPLSPRLANAYYHPSPTLGTPASSSRESSVARTDDEPDVDEEEEEEEAFLGTIRPLSNARSNHAGAANASVKSAQRRASPGQRFSPGPLVDQVTALSTELNYLDSSIQTPRPSTPLYNQSTFASLSDIVQATPTRETIIDKTIITEEEKQIHSEFFCNKASKTPERYQRIRNTIISTWERVRPHYVTKTSVRAGLKDCGDVNAIGRVHSWLESIGAINVGLTANSPGASLARPRNGGNQRKKAQMRMEAGYGNLSHRSNSQRNSLSEPSEAGEIENLAVHGSRRRRVRNERGEWTDEKSSEGRVVENNDRMKWIDIDDIFSATHGLTREELEEEYEQQRLAAMNARYFAESEALPEAQSWVPKNKRAQHLLRQQNKHHHHHHHSMYDNSMESGGVGSKYDPFRLVPLQRYGAKCPAPFRVIVSSDAMVVMDFHAHLAHTEIIGLLGGVYDEVAKELRIESVFPCKSLSTGLQCEMDPASEMEARDYFEQRGMVVVGWYHSHPTFEPNPSIRDIENQVNYQDLFRRPQDGIEPFVGVIVSPYDPSSLAMVSKIQFLSISQQVDDRLGCRIPYACDREIAPTEDLSVKLFEQLSGLVKDYRNYEHRVNLSLALRASGGGDGSGHMGAASSVDAIITTRLEKLLRSLSANIYVDEATASTFLDKVKELVVRGFQLGLDLMNIPSIKERNDAAISDQPAGHPQPEQPSPSLIPGNERLGVEAEDENIDVLMESGKVSPPDLQQGFSKPPTSQAISQDKLQGEPDEDVDIEGHSSADYEMRSAASSPKS